MHLFSRSFTLILLISLCSYRASAQTDFRSGYIVQPAGDTVRGEVDFRGARRSSLQCQFRSSSGALVQTFQPQQLRAYGFPGVKEFRSCLTPMPDSADKPQAARQFFLEIMASGTASLYTRRNASDATFWYLQKGATPAQELVYKRSRVYVEGREVIRDINTFRNTLSVAFTDCPELSLEVLRTEFTSGALVRVVNSYNACRQPTVKVLVKRRKTHLSLAGLAGLQTSRLSFPEHPHLRNGTFVASAAPTFGLAAQIVSPQLNEKLMLRIEALYGRQEYSDEFAYVSPYYSNASDQVYFKLTYLRVPVLLRYTFAGRIVRPLAELGATFSRALQTETGARFRYSASTPYEAWGPALPESSIRAIEMGLTAGIGAQIAWPTGHPISVLGRFERSNGLSSEKEGRGSVFRYDLLLGINLTK